jgi:cellulose synthase operon protein C
MPDALRKRASQHQAAQRLRRALVSEERFGKPIDGRGWGLPVGANFINPVNGKSGKIQQILHKYVAKHHFVLAQHEARFPSVSAFRSLPIDVSTPEGLAPLLEELKAKHYWVEQEQENYQKGPWPLAILAHRLGCDTIEIAEGLAAQGIRLKVALGAEIERNAALSAITSNNLAGCVLDLHSFWTCWRLGVRRRQRGLRYDPYRAKHD